MKFFKKIFKKSKAYKFFDYNFKKMDSEIEKIQLKINELEKKQSILDDIQNKINTINDLQNNSIQNQNIMINELNVLKNRTEQFESINSELLLLNRNNNKEEVLIVGFYGAPNTGDELMLQSILSKINTDDINVTVMVCNNPDYKLINYKNIKFIHYPKTNMDINIIVNFFDKIIFGGGALLEDEHYFEKDSYKYNTGTILIELSIAAILNNKKTYHIGLSTSYELTNKEYINKLDYIIENSCDFSLRDTNSLETLKKCKIENLHKIKVVPDLVYSLPSISYDFEKINYSEDFIIGMILIGFSDFEKLKNILIWIQEYKNKIKKNIKIKLIPFYNYLNSDIVNFQKVLDNLNTNNTIEICPYFQKYEDIANTFLGCNLIINMRYHSSLLCLKFGIPSVHIVYDIHPHYKNKMDYLKNIYSLSDSFVSYKDISKIKLEKSLDYVVNNSNQIHLLEKHMSEKIEEEAVKQHREIIKNILKD